MDYNPREIDARYKPLEPFSAWQNLFVDEEIWQRYTQRLNTQREQIKDQKDLTYALERVRRAAAIDTGAIEGLYDVDRGFTFTVAMQAAGWEQVLNAKDAITRQTIATQIETYEYVLDFATQRQQIVQSWIRELHSQITRDQTTYRVWTEAGWQDHQLVHGSYKNLPNHVITPDGTAHAYAPVDQVSIEMQRLCDEFQTEEFNNAHPAIQSAYAHYAFVAIHPFADGNGRVARALASIFTYRALSVPVLILSEHRAAYFDALHDADNGGYQAFVDFIAARIVDSIQLVLESFTMIGSEPATKTTERLENLYRTKGGYTHEQVDNAGAALIKQLWQDVQQYTSTLELPKRVKISARAGSATYEALHENMRVPHSGGKGVVVVAESAVPALATVTQRFLLEVPKDCDIDDEVLIRDNTGQRTIAARVQDVIPHLSAVLAMRMRLVAERIVSAILNELYAKAEDRLRKDGY